MKPSKTKNIIGTVLITIVSVVFLLSAFSKLFGAQAAVDMFNQLGIDDLRVRLGLIELLTVFLLWIPRTRWIGMLVATGYLGGAIATEFILHGAPVLPGLLIIFVWIGSAFRMWGFKHSHHCANGACMEQNETCNCGKNGCVCAAGKCTC